MHRYFVFHCFRINALHRPRKHFKSVELAINTDYTMSCRLVRILIMLIDEFCKVGIVSK